MFGESIHEQKLYRTSTTVDFSVFRLNVFSHWLGYLLYTCMNEWTKHRYRRVVTGDWITCNWNGVSTCPSHQWNLAINIPIIQRQLLASTCLFFPSMGHCWRLIFFASTLNNEQVTSDWITPFGRWKCCTLGKNWRRLVTPDVSIFYIKIWGVLRYLCRFPGHGSILSCSLSLQNQRERVYVSNIGAGWLQCEEDRSIHAQEEKEIFLLRVNIAHSTYNLLFLDPHR